MRRSTFVKILRTFDRKELKMFRRMVNSPFFCTSRAASKLFEEIKKYYPEFEHKNFSKNYLFGKVYEGKKYNDVLFRKLLSNLIKLADEFLFIKGVRSYRFKTNFYYYMELSERGLNSIHNRKFEHNLSQLKKLPVVESDYYGLFAENLMQRSLHQNLNNDIKASFESSLLAGEYMVLNLYIQYCATRGIEDTLSRIYKINSEGSLLRKFGEMMSNEKNHSALTGKFVQEKGLIWLFENYGTPEGKKIDSKVILKMKKAVFDNFHRFSRAQKRNFLYDLLEKLRYNEEFSESERNSFEYEIYSVMLREKLYSRSEGLPMHVNTFVNIVNCFITAGLNKETENFIEEYKDKLPGEYADSSGHFGLARVSFKKRKFEDAIMHASMINLKLIPYCYLGRSLMIMSHLELKNAESALYLIDSFTHFLKLNRSVSAYHQKRFLMFNRYTKALANYFLNSNSEKLLKSYSSLRKEVNFGGKQWLIEKFEYYSG